MAVWLAYHTDAFAPENMPDAFMFAAPDPIVSLADELAALSPTMARDLSTFTTVKLFDTPTGGYADTSFSGVPVNYRGVGRGNSFAVSAANAGVAVWLIYRPLGVPGHESGFHSALIGAANAAAAVVAAKALVATYGASFEGYRVLQVGVSSAAGFKNTVFEGDATEFYGLTPGGDQPVKLVPNGGSLGVAAGTTVYQNVVTGSRKGTTQDVTQKNFRGSNPMNVRNVILIGASIEEYSFGNATQGAAQLKTSVADLAARLGLKSVVGRGVASETFPQIYITATAAKAEFLSTQGSNLYIVHAGGNDVTTRRPYISVDDDAYFQGHMRALFDLLATGGDQVVFTNLSKRLYQTNPVAPLPAEDLTGSKLYNDALFDPFIRANSPGWWDYQANRPYLDMYRMTERHEDVWLRADDGVHPHPGSFQATQGFMLGRIVAQAMGIVNKPGVRSGRAYLYIPRTGVYPVYNTIANWVRVESQGQNNQGKGVAVGGWDMVGNYDPFIEFATKGFTGGNPAGGDGVGAHARLADTRLHTGAIGGYTDSIYAANATDPAPMLRFAGLVPGETGKLTVAGSRVAADATRKCNWTLNGADSRQTDAATNAASNSQTWAFTVPAGGVLTLQGTGIASNTAYVSTVLIEFD